MSRADIPVHFPVPFCPALSMIFSRRGSPEEKNKAFKTTAREEMAKTTASKWCTISQQKHIDWKFRLESGTAIRFVPNNLFLKPLLSL